MVKKKKKKIWNRVVSDFSCNPRLQLAVLRVLRLARPVSRVGSPQDSQQSSLTIPNTSDQITSQKLTSQIWTQYSQRATRVKTANLMIYISLIYYSQ